MQGVQGGYGSRICGGSQYDSAWANRRGATELENLSHGEEPWTYRMVFTDKGGPRICLVEGCPVRAATRMAMQVQFLYQHVLDTVVIMEEGNLPHPRCP